MVNPTKYQCEFEDGYDADSGKMHICGKKAVWKYKGKNLCQDHADYALAVYGVPKELQKEKMKQL